MTRPGSIARVGRTAKIVERAGSDVSIWGKIIGGAAGFALGGPIGALMGVIGGHAIDRYAAPGDPID